MKTGCPHCQTIFLITPEQLKVRAGRVRCGNCWSVFNALDSLIEEAAPVGASHAPTNLAAEEKSPVTPEPKIDIPPDPPEAVKAVKAIEPAKPVEPAPPLSESQAKELGRATGLILPRETTEIPGYSKWTEGVMATVLPSQEGKSPRWPFILAAIFLSIGLMGQIVFHFRSQIAVSIPVLRPALNLLCKALNKDIPLLRRVEWVSIESSDLQNDAAHGNLLVLNATLRNRAKYRQAYPSLELSLTDTHDVPIARRVFSPDDYLSPELRAKQVFAANSNTAIRLWIEAKNISAAGYRLYVFYP